MKADLLIFFAVCVAVADSFDCSELNSKYSNGCEVEGFTPEWGEDFKPACEGLDVCYECGASLRHNFTRKDCDDKFWNHMDEICDAQSWWWYLQCHTSKAAYYAGVRMFGYNIYIANTRRVGDLCHQPEAAQCMSG